ncbi:mechanosensitive ion channel protein MscS [Caldalkalibacillus thermarum]|uniref:mechanosensitive ion channel family protein n=1 Tax=Caldalkalibacillus thermarum TaxID=296745 RepID=UPI0016630B14|nr:mechanosensitive ion channel family protein [Caldalkalibacillus thermarum]GGK25103.1 mechanosensitive ion channel protein MscS [Caldalkalibacillus thermarum]
MIDIMYALMAWLTSGAFWVQAGYVLLKIVVIMLLARLVISLGQRMVHKLLTVRHNRFLSLPSERQQTIQSLLNSVLRNVIYFIAILVILAELGFSIGPVLAGLGIVGLAVGFGAQNLVRDVLSGFFILLEDQFSVGDFVTIGQYTGTVQEFGLRITKIKEFTGQVHIIPNGHITEVTNYSRENAVAVLDVGISYDTPINRAEQVLEKLLAEFAQTEEDVVGDPSVLGVQDLGESEVVIRITVPCRPMTHWALARKLRKMVKERFDQEGIDIPFPQLVVHQHQAR